MSRRWITSRLIFAAGFLYCCLLVIEMGTNTSYLPLASIVASLFETTSGKLQLRSEIGTNRSVAMLRRYSDFRNRCRQLYGDAHQVSRDVPFDLRHLIFDDKYKLVYCYIPKIACSNFIRVFLMLTGKVQQTQPFEITDSEVNSLRYKYLSLLNQLKNETEVMHRLKNYKKIMFVREPFERLLSAWRSKFESNKDPHFQTTYGRNIIRMFRKNASEESLIKGHDVSFNEFIQYVIYLNDNKQAFDEHWRKYTDLCNPCEVDYDFIGNFETLDEDMDYLLEDIGVGEFIHFPKRNEAYKDAKTTDVLTQFYKDIPKRDIERINDIYANDFFLFDFNIPTAIQKLLEDV